MKRILILVHRFFDWLEDKHIMFRILIDDEKWIEKKEAEKRRISRTLRAVLKKDK